MSGKSKIYCNIYDRDGTTMQTWQPWFKRMQEIALPKSADILQKFGGPEYAGPENRGKAEARVLHDYRCTNGGKSFMDFRYALESMDCMKEIDARLTAPKDREAFAAAKEEIAYQYVKQRIETMEAEPGFKEFAQKNRDAGTLQVVYSDGVENDIPGSLTSFGMTPENVDLVICLKNPLERDPNKPMSRTDKLIEDTNRKAYETLRAAGKLVVLGTDDHKPMPTAIEVVQKRFGLTGDQIAYAGDSPNDVLCARGIMKTRSGLAVKPGFDPVHSVWQKGGTKFPSDLIAFQNTGPDGGPAAYLIGPKTVEAHLKAKAEQVNLAQRKANQPPVEGIWPPSVVLEDGYANGAREYFKLFELGNYKTLQREKEARKKLLIGRNRRQHFAKVRAVGRSSLMATGRPAIGTAGTGPRIKTTKPAINLIRAARLKSNGLG